MSERVFSIAMGRIHGHAVDHDVHDEAVQDQRQVSCSTAL